MRYSKTEYLVLEYRKGGNCMEIEKLRTFITVAQSGTISKAAEILYLTQSNVTKQIKSLENELQRALLVRTSKGVSLTKEGTIFLNTALRIVDEWDQYYSSIQTQPHTLAFGTSTSFSMHFVPQYLSLFKTHYPHMKLVMKSTHSKEILNMLETGEIEFGILSEYIPFDRAIYTHKKIGEDRLVIILPPQHPLKGRKTVTLTELAHEPYVAKSTDSALHRFLISTLGPDSFLTHPYIETGSQSAVKAAVMQGMGISIVSQQMIEQDVKNGTVLAVELEDCILVRDIYCVFKKQHIKNPNIQKFLHLFSSNA